MGPACAMVAGAWFLMREVELATTRAHLVSLEKGPDGEDVVRWHLPASKTDVEARGVSRVHGCSCLAEGRVGSCPFHAAKFQFARLRRLFPQKWKRGSWDLELPFFPDEHGRVVSKDVMTATIREAGRRLAVQASSPDGSEKLTGHSLRVTGAQGLARAGLEVWAIQLLGRWGSQTVLDYVREVPLEHSRLWAARAAKLSAIDDVLRNPALAASRAPVPAPPSSATPAVPCQGPLEREALAQALDEAKDAAEVLDLPLSDSQFLNCPGGKWHRIPKTGMLGASSSWTAACGWRFAGSLASLASDPTPRVCHKFLCARCFPELRAQVKSGA